MSDVQFDRDRIDSLIVILQRIPALTERPARDALFTELRTALRRPFDPVRSDDPATDLTALVEAAIPYSGGPQTLASLVRRAHPGTPADELMIWVDDLTGPQLLSTMDRDALRDILADISIMDIADAVDVLGDVPDLRSLRTWRDLSAAIRAMERLPRGIGKPPLLGFVAKLAEVVTGAEAEQLQAWLRTVSPGFAEVPPPPGVAKLPHHPLRPPRADEPGYIWGNVPGRNRHFTGRTELLDRLTETLRAGSRTSVLPQTLQGLGGVGKTQLVVEYVYRHRNEYDLVWWIPAEQTSTVLSSVAELAQRLGLPASENSSEVARSVVAALAVSDLDWLLVYDNADDPEALRPYIPSTGGHVIVTTRNQDWGGIGPSLEVDVFRRDESVDMLTNRTREAHDGGITEAEADKLAERLGDLPLALEQAAAWYLATRMPVQEYIDLLGSHIKELLNEGKPASYSLSIAAFVAVALKELRTLTLRELPDSTGVAAQLFSLFAYLGGEPVAVALFRAGSQADLSEPLRSTLSSSIPTNRAVRVLSQYGLAKVDAKQRVQVHRLVQRVLLDTLTAEQQEETKRNVRNLLTAANPGDPDEEGEHDRQIELGPHVEPADLIHSDNDSTRQVVLDHSRYLYIRGDYENCQKLATKAAEAWAKDTSSPKTGPEGEQTLQARAQIANAMRTLGYSREAAAIMSDVYARQRASLGPDHELTVVNGNQVGQDLRIAGKYEEALRFDTENKARSIAVFRHEHPYTLRAQANLAVDHRMIGQFGEALVLDKEIAEHWENAGAVDVRALNVYMNVARNYYGMGAYQTALDWLEEWQQQLREKSGPSHGQVLLAARTHAITLRKLGRLEEAATLLADNLEATHKRFRSNHEFALAAATSYANALREIGRLDQAAELFTDAIGRYREYFGPAHPLTLVAEVNEGILRRARGDLDHTREPALRCFAELSRLLSREHPYAIGAGSALANDYAATGEWQAALELGQRLSTLGTAGYQVGTDERGGGDHPYVLARRINLSHYLRRSGRQERADELFTEAVAGLRTAFGDNHPDVAAAVAGSLLEGDIEPPPT